MKKQITSIDKSQNTADSVQKPEQQPQPLNEPPSKSYEPHEIAALLTKEQRRELILLMAGKK